MIDRARIFRGELLALPASAESVALARIAANHASRAFACAMKDLRTVHERGDAGDVWKRTCAARAAIAEDDALRASSIELAALLGFSRAALAYDAVRLRVVTPHMHDSRDAERAFYMHRDTWYGSPRAQINVWIPLFDVDERDSFAIWPGAFAARVDNDSCAFDLDGFEFQSSVRADEVAYPRALAAPPGDAVRVRARACEVLAFSAAHLHATTPNETPTTRWSIDVRFVDMSDVTNGRGALDVDNAAKGDVLGKYFRVSP